MTRTQRLQLRQSEARQKLGTLLDMPTEQRAETWQADLDALKSELTTLESEYQAALLAEPEAPETRSDDTPEQREMRDLLEQSSVADYFSEALNGVALDGASRELRSELLDDSHGVGWLPIDLLLDPVTNDLEQRADAATNVASAVQDHQQNIVGRAFAPSSGAYMGVQRPTVPAGDTTYVTLATGATADFRSDGVAKDAEAAGFTTKTVSPVRVTARYLFGIESTVRYRGFEEALRADLSAVMSDKLDNVALNGLTAVSNVSPAIEGLISQLADPADPSNTLMLSDIQDLYLSRVDGKYSQDGSNVRILTNADVFKAARKLASTTGEPIDNWIPSGRFRVSSNMPATASTIATVLSYASGRRGFVQPVWRGVQLIRDPYSNAASGQIALTVAMLTGAAMVDSNVYGRHELKVP